MIVACAGQGRTWQGPKSERETVPEPGAASAHGQRRDLWPRSTAVRWPRSCCSPDRYAAGQMTQRLPEAVFAGWPPLTPATIHDAERFAAYQLHVTGSADVIDTSIGIAVAAFCLYHSSRPDRVRRSGTRPYPHPWRDRGARRQVRQQLPRDRPPRRLPGHLTQVPAVRPPRRRHGRAGRSGPRHPATDTDTPGPT